MNEDKPHGPTGLGTLPEVHLTHSPSLGALAAALAKAQSVTESAPKNHTAEVTMKSGGKYSYSYADLAGVWDAVRAPLSANGLAAVQAWTLRPDGLAMTTMLAHSSGEWVRGEMAGFPVPDRTPQGVGTSVTYARRYTLGAMTGAVSEEDDDGGNGGKPKAASGGGTAPRDAGKAPVTFPNFGKAAGQPIQGAALKDLEFYAERMRESISSPEKANFKAKNEAMLKAIEAEIAHQRGSGGTAPMDRISALAKELGIPGPRVAEWLKGNGLKDRSAVTETFVEAFRTWASEQKPRLAVVPLDDDAPF
jgi:hypothetical protein